MNEAFRQLIDYAVEPGHLELLDDHDQELVKRLASKSDQYVLSPREAHRLNRICRQIDEAA